MRHIKIALPVLVFILTLLLIRQNLEVLNQQVQFRLNLLVVTLQSANHSLWVILFFTFFIGVLGTGLFSLVEVFKYRSESRQLRHDLEILKSELHTLKPETAPRPEEVPPGAAPE
jgi:uncharacterized integral membrane protein